jgi:hypothetical protein
MKRTELVVGAELAYQRRTSAADSTYGIEKAVVLAVEPHEKGYRGREARPVSNGNGVLVSISTRFLGRPDVRTEVVQLSTLVGDFAAEMARREAAEAADRTRREQWEAQKNAHHAEFDPALRAMMTQIESTTGKYVSDYTELRKLPLEVVQAITAALAAQNAKVA